MLMRKFQEWMQAVPLGAAQFKDRIDTAQRCIFTASATEAAAQIADAPRAIDAARAQIFAPFPNLWMEFTRPAVGPVALAWFGAADSTQRGGGIVVEWLDGAPVMVPIHIDLTAADYITIPPEMDRLAAQRSAAGLTSIDVGHAREHLVKVGRMMLAGWAILATKGLTHSVPVNVDRLNKSRASRGLYPLLGYSEIRLNIDVERAISARQRKPSVGTDTTPLHPVRAHLRLLPTGRVTIVRAHMRGNPDYGTRGHHYTVHRSEDFA